MTKSKVKMFCTECCATIDHEEEFYEIYGEPYCKECAKQWLLDDIEERFDDFMDEIADLLGVSKRYNVNPIEEDNEV